MKDFEDLREELRERKRSKRYNQNFINRQLHEKEHLRRVYLALVDFTPAIISDVIKDTNLTKPTCYTQLGILTNYKIAKRIHILDFETNKLTKNKEVLKKWNKFSKGMPENSKRYFMSKTSMFCLTEFGKSFLGKALEFDKEFKE